MLASIDAHHPLEWLARGISVFPCKADKTPDVSSRLWYATHLPTEAAVRGWARNHVAYGIVTGWHGLVVLDFDDLALWSQWRTWAAAENLEASYVAECSYQVATARGVHVYVYSDRQPRQMHMQGFDLQSRGAYVIGAGSRHPTGAVYQALNPGAPIVRVADVMRLLPPNLRPKQPAATGRDSPILASTVRIPTVASIGSVTALDALAHALTGRELLELAKSPETARIWEMLGIPRAEIRDSGPNYGMARCPLHDDEHPSLSVDFATNRVSCQAGCTGAHGWSNLDVVMHARHVDIMTAAHVLTGR